jgi:putative flippase GtrA
MKKLIFFGIGGVLTLSLKLISSFFLTEIILFPFYLSYLLTLLIIIFFSFLYNYYITFNNKTKMYLKLLKYLFAIGIFYLLDYILTILMVNIYQFFYLISILIITILIFILKFITFNFFIFKEE